MEEKEENAESPKTLGREKVRLILQFLKPMLPFFVIALLCSMLNTAFNSLTPQVVKVTVDSILGGKALPFSQAVVSLLGLNGFLEHPLSALLLAACAVLLVAALSGVCSYLSRMDIAKGSEGFVKALRDRLFSHIQKLPFAWHSQHQTGEIIQRCTSDVEVVRNFVCNQLVEVFRTVFLVALSMGIMLSMNVRVSLVALGFIPVIVLYSVFFYSRVARRFRTADEAEGALSSTVQENLTGVRVVRAFGREAFEIERFDDKNRRFADLWIKLGNLLSAYWGIGDLMTGLQVLMVIVFGVLETVNGTLTLGGFLAIVSYNATLIWPVRGLGRILSEMSKAGVSIDRIAYILKAEEEKDPPQAKTPPMDRDIRFEHVHFAYEGVQPVLENINFTIPAGSTFAILGATGSGKSTLIHLLDRLYDLPKGCGRITIGGVDIAEISREYLRRNIGLVLQEPFLYSRTIQENICAVRPSAPLEETRAAARIACVDDAIEEFPLGYDTVVGERGVTLSGGQKQRVAIARMLIQHAPIMVFDDSLSAVDAQTDAQIRAALQRNLGKSTVILISHRITTLMQADQILVLANGRVADLGTHAELIGRPGIYRSIYEIQMSSDDRALLQEGGEANGV